MSEDKFQIREVTLGGQSMLPVIRIDRGIAEKLDKAGILLELKHTDRLQVKPAQEAPFTVDISGFARSLFDAYNEQGPNPWKTWDGKDVPRWTDTNDQVRGKWEAAAREAITLVRETLR